MKNSSDLQCCEREEQVEVTKVRGIVLIMGSLGRKAFDMQVDDLVLPLRHASNSFPILFLSRYVCSLFCVVAV